MEVHDTSEEAAFVVETAEEHVADNAQETVVVDRD